MGLCAGLLLAATLPAGPASGQAGPVPIPTANPALPAPDAGLAEPAPDMAFPAPAADDARALEAAR
ncbi:MAG: hypothetical protein HXY25_04885, partial [Alphaproteobacteria bacterium]|nr:hypothetical protein [Alphaproteobacteria bacterium]